MPRGGKTKLTPEQERTLLHLVSLGAYPSQAALKVGVTPQAISMRKKRDADFALRLQMAEATAEFSMLAEVRMSKDPRIILELMARRFRERWARAEAAPRVRVEASASAAAAATTAASDPQWRAAIATIPGFAPMLETSTPPAPPPPPAASAEPEDPSDA